MESLLCLRRACATKALSSRACTCTKLYRCWHRRSASDWQKLSLMLILSMMIYNDIMYEKLTRNRWPPWWMLEKSRAAWGPKHKAPGSSGRHSGPTASTVCSWNRLLYRPIGSHWIRLDPIGMVGLRICLLCEVLKVIYLHTLSQIGSTGFPLFIKGGGGVGDTPLPAILEHSVRTGLAYRSGEFHPIYL